MFKLRLSILAVAFVLLAGLALSQTALATYAVPDANTGHGQVAAVNFAARTITVNGHEYKLAPKAAVAGGGVHNMGGLQPGMKIQFVADGPLDNPASVITNIVVLPPASQ